MTTADAAPISVTTVVPLDPRAAFELFTAEVDAWWRQGRRFRPALGEGGRLRFEPREGGRLIEAYREPEGQEFELGRVRVWEPASRLVFEMGGRAFERGQSTEVEVRFEAEGPGTRVTVEHRGFEQLPAGHPARHGLAGRAFDDLMGTWWADLVLALRHHAARAGAGSA